MTINQQKTFCSMFFHKLLARVCQTLKMKIRCFGYGYETTKLEYKRRECNLADMTPP